jgi:hypothetical protein
MIGKQTGKERKHLMKMRKMMDLSALLLINLVPFAANFTEVILEECSSNVVFREYDCCSLFSLGGLN